MRRIFEIRCAGYVPRIRITLCLVAPKRLTQNSIFVAKSFAIDQTGDLARSAWHAELQAQVQPVDDAHVAAISAGQLIPDPPAP